MRVCVLAAIVFSACSSLSRENARIASTPQHLHLRRGTDQDILRQVGFDPTKMKPDETQGPDGYATDYTAPNGEWVSILRSASTGIFVMYGDRTGQKSSWELGFHETSQ